MNPDRLTEIIQFYELLDLLEEKLGGKHTLANCNGRMGWPRRGVYFFFEKGEYRTTSGTGMRLVRIGTHALKPKSRSTLWKRLKQHQGTLKDGGGNHRGSVFRKHVGTALINRDQWNTDGARTWGQGSSARKEIRAKELPLERAVSQYIRKMPFIWVTVDDPPGSNSLRGYIERNSIALLSNFNRTFDPIDPPSPEWLGKWALNPYVQKSGLLNSNHVSENYDADFIERFEKIISDL